MNQKNLILSVLPGVLLLLATILGMISANSPWRDLYSTIIHVNFSVGFDDLRLSKELLLWINDGLMALFFLLVALEIKKEVVYGSLSNPRTIILPVITALGGVIVPIGIFLFCTSGHPSVRYGWAIPAATDIAFAVGLLSLFKNKMPKSLFILLLTVAVLDDLIAIVIIAIFYTSKISMTALVLTLPLFLTLWLLNRNHVTNLSLYLVIGAILWFCLLQSGVHATLGGVILGFLIPAKTPERPSPLEKLEHGLHPWSNYLILPLFAFVNSGIELNIDTFKQLLSPLSLGIFLGLVVGKPLGIISFSWFAVQSKIATLPKSINWHHMTILGLFCGIGFTMSYFISSLAFQISGNNFSSMSRLAILCASVTSALLGIIAVSLCKKENRVGAPISEALPHLK